LHKRKGFVDQGGRDSRKVFAAVMFQDGNAHGRNDVKTKEHDSGLFHEKK
jgi:hypothetical protein